MKQHGIKMRNILTRLGGRYRVKIGTGTGTQVPEK
jgi:hypothetical protein